MRSGVQDKSGQHGKTVSTLKIKISQAWWCMPVIPAIREAEAGESFKLWRWRLQWTKIMPLHSSLDDKVRLELKTKQILFPVACKPKGPMSYVWHCPCELTSSTLSLSSHSTHTVHFAVCSLNTHKKSGSCPVLVLVWLPVMPARLTFPYLQVTVQMSPLERFFFPDHSF